MDDQSIAHTKWNCQYHIVFIPKYRRKALYGKVLEDIRDIIRTLCRYKGVKIIEGAVCVNHVHLCLSIPPKLSVSEFIYGIPEGQNGISGVRQAPRAERKI